MEAPFLYRFGEFALNVRERQLLANGASVEIRAKPFDVLVYLVERAGSLVPKEDLLRDVWEGIDVEEGNIPWNISQVRQALGDDPRNPTYIETVPKQGYRFIAEVEVAGLDEAPEPEAPEPVPSTPYAEPSSWYLGHAAVACTMYALLWVVALFVEVAYQFDRIGWLAWRFAPWVFAWIFTTSALTFWVDWQLTRRGSATGLIASAAAFVVAGFALATVVGGLLPAGPVTEASFHTYPAESAYLKSAYYFVPLAVVYIAIPFHLLIALGEELRAGNGASVVRLFEARLPRRAPRGALYLKASWLGILLVVAVCFTVAGSAHLLENLAPGDNAGVFVRTYQWRLGLYFLLGCECLVWFGLMLNEVQHAAERVTPSRSAVRGGERG